MGQPQYGTSNRVPELGKDRTVQAEHTTPEAIVGRRAVRKRLVRHWLPLWATLSVRLVQKSNQDGRDDVI